MLIPAFRRTVFRARSLDVEVWLGFLRYMLDLPRFKDDIAARYTRGRTFFVFMIDRLNA